MSHFAGIPASSLIFTRDDPCSTRITDGTTGELVYIVSTQYVQQPRKRTLTEVRKPAGETLAVFEWGDFLKSDVVTLQFDQRRVLISGASDWLKKSAIPFNDTVTFRDEQWKPFKWKGYAPGLALELCSDNKLAPLAKFHKSRPGSPAYLALDPSISSVTHKRDWVVAAFLYLEKSRRERDA